MKANYFLCLFMTLIACQMSGTEVGLTDEQKHAPSNEWGPLTDNTQISIALNPATSQIVTNQNPQFIARIKNLSTNEVFHLYVGAAFLASRGMSFTITSPSGKDISPVFYNNFIAESGITVWVPPGKVDGFIVGLQQFCKLDELGTYKITMTVQRGSPDRHKLYNVVSNPLFVTVIPSH